MKYIYLLLFLILLISSCALPKIERVPKIHKTETNSSIFDNVTFMPYIMVIGTEKTPNHGSPGFWDREILGKGYINAETFEIIIPAQYERAGNFVGNFAIVENRENHKDMIINKKNEIILSGFDGATLYQSEDGNTVFALTANISGVRRSIYTGVLNTPLYEPANTTYRLYNLNTGRIVINRDKRSFGNEKIPKIMFFGNYMTYDKDVYELKANGDLEENEIGFDEFLGNVTMQVNLYYDRKKISPHFWDREMREFLLSNDTLDKHLTDINLMLKEVPDNLRIRGYSLSAIWEYGDDWTEKIDFTKYYPLNWDKSHPLVRKNWLYEIEFVDRRQDQYFGLYNPFENIWVIPPTVPPDYFSHFHQTSYDDWIRFGREGGGGVFFNIKTRKKYKDLYHGSPEAPMYYRGHLLQERKDDYKEAIIEDF